MGRYRVIDNNIIDRQGILNLLKNFIFGSSDVEIYDRNRKYKIGDKAFIIDTTTGDIKVVTANQNNVTGEYDPSKWVNATLSDSIGGSDKVIVISKYRPREMITKLWLTPDEFGTHYIAMPGYQPGTEPEPDEPGGDPIIPPDPPIVDNDDGLIFISNEIPIVDDTNTAELGHLISGDIVLDIEGEGIMNIEGLTSLVNGFNLIIDEQEDVLVSPNEPINDDRIILWIDTDLSDDIW